MQNLPRFYAKKIGGLQKTKELISVDVDSCFLFIGYLPNTDIFKDTLNMDKRGYLLTNERMETNQYGVFAAGDVRDKFLKQVATAVGDGAVAGYGAEKYIAEKHTYEQQILNNGEKSLVFFFNSVDPYCRDLLPLIEEAELRYLNIKVTKVDVYKSDGLARRVNINHYPTVALFNKNQLQKVIKETINIEQISQLVEQ